MEINQIMMKEKKFKKFACLSMVFNLTILQSQFELKMECEI